MRFLKCVVSSPEQFRGDVELLALDHILNIMPRKNGYELKILMGAGLAWYVFRDSVEVVEISTTDDLKNMNWEV